MSRSQQEETVLRAIVISSSMSIGGQIVPHYDRQTAFQVLTEFKNFDGRIPMCLSWLQQESIRTHNNHTRLSSSSIHNNNNNNNNNNSANNNINHINGSMEEDITVPTKLFALDLLSDFLTKRYSSLRPEERLALRQAVLTSARQLAPTRSDVAEARILGNKLATLLAGLIVRDFPQRWTSLMDDVFSPVILNGRGGGLWCTDNNVNNNNNNNNVNNSSSSSLSNAGTSEDQSTMGVKICLEVLKLVAEDCTDSDFNAKISAQRRNDVLLGLNEVSSHFLPLLFRLLEHHVSVMATSKASLHQMRTYLLQHHQTLVTMTPEQASAYQTEMHRLEQAGRIVADTLITLEKFCRSMPLDWIIPSSESSSSSLSSSSSTAASSLSQSDSFSDAPSTSDLLLQQQQQQQQLLLQPPKPQLDFSAAFLHLLREPRAGIQIVAVDCIEQLLLRGKLTFSQWMRLVQELPTAIAQTNQQFAVEQEHAAAEVAVVSSLSSMSYSTPPPAVPPNVDPLTAQIDFHRPLSRMLANVISSHLSHVSYDKKLLSKGGPEWTNFSNFLRLLVDMLHHPSGRLCGEQINMWTSVLRDPQVLKARLLQPFVQEILSCYMDHMVRIRWVDVEEGTHPLASLMEASWEDEEDYEAWVCDMRSRASQLFKFIGNYEPHIAATAINSRLQGMVTTHGNGEPRDHIHPTNGQLTQLSEAVRQFEGLVQPLENILCGLPTWSLQSKQQVQGGGGEKDGSRAQVRASTQASLSELARTVVSWNPTHLWLKFRKAQLLDALKHYWEHDPSTLLQGIDALLGYVGAPDEWSNGELQADGSTRMSGETVSLRKKSSTALVAVARQVPQHLVPWLSQLSVASRALLSSEDLLPTIRMHLYEFLSCVATAVHDPVLRANFVSDVLSDAISVLESQEAQEALQSVDSFLASIGVAQAREYPGSVTDAANVRQVTARFSRLFSAVNQLLSVGKRCNEAARKRPNGGIPVQAMSPDFEEITQSFADEGPVSLRDLSVNDPFVPLWPRILPNLLKLVDVLLRIWRPEHQAVLLQDRIQRYALAISDDDAYLTRRNDTKAGGVFGEGGTAGSVIPGTDRRDLNLAPRWSSWLNELRNACFQMLGMCAGQRVLFAPEMSDSFPRFVAVVVEPRNLHAMEHRHFTQYMKQFIEILMLSCPHTLYMTHLAPILGPVFEHLQYRLDKTWLPIISSAVTPDLCKPIYNADCVNAAALASRGGDDWFVSYYARTGLFVGDVDVVTGEAAVEKSRVELSRTFSDMLQTALALKGDWALVLANFAKEEQSNRRNDSNKLSLGPRTRIQVEGFVNADGTPKTENQAEIDARKLQRISAMCHFLFLGHEQIAGSITLLVIQCLAYPDAYTCRRITRICHRILETVAWYPRYTELLGNRMFLAAIKNIVTEPKWMVGTEWDMINVVRDIYIRLVLGQVVQPGGQGVALQQAAAGDNPNNYEQAKTADLPLQGGGILVIPSDIPRQVLASLPGVDSAMINQLDANLKRKKSAKDQKDVIRDLLRIASEQIKQADDAAAASFANGLGGSSINLGGVLERAVEEESLLRNHHRKAEVEDIPEKLVTHSMMVKKHQKTHNQDQEQQSSINALGLAAFQL